MAATISTNISPRNYNMGKVMIVAEISANHGGSRQTALDTIRAAKRAGADAVKLQTYTPDTLTLDCDAPDFIINNGSIWDGSRYYDLYKEAYTPWEWHEELFHVVHLSLFFIIKKSKSFIQG